MYQSLLNFQAIGHASFELTNYMEVQGIKQKDFD